MILDAGMNQKSTREILLAAKACLKRLADVSSGSDEWIKIYWLGARMPRRFSNLLREASLSEFSYRSLRVF